MPLRVFFVLLIAVALAWFVVSDTREYSVFKEEWDTRVRQRFFRRWIVRGLVMFVVSSFLLLWLFGQLEAIMSFPDRFRPLIAAARGGASAKQSSDGTVGLVLGVGLALGGGLLAMLISARRRGLLKQVRISSTDYLVPRNPQERWLAIALCASAGIGEELFFRLTLPLLLCGLIEKSWIAVGIASVAFGLMHAYQGWKGIVLTAGMGLVFTFVYFLTESLWITIVFHFVNNAYALVFRPWLAGRLRMPVDDAPPSPIVEA